jgi:hypothetical protein
MRRLLQNMNIFPSSSLTPDLVAGQQIYLDADMLGVLVRDKTGEQANQFFGLFAGATFIIHPLIRFEFLRDIFVPKQRAIKEDFIDDKEWFVHDVDHQEVHVKVRDRAMDLSQIYAHAGQKTRHTGWSTIDLILAARVGTGNKDTLLLTGNRKDYPSVVFDQLATIVFSNSDDSQSVFTLLRFNADAYSACMDGIKRLEKI